MQIVVHKLDWYTKLVLTIIAAALVVTILKPLYVSQKATAAGERHLVDVNLNIDRIGGEKVLRWWEADRAEKGIPIYIDGRIITEKSE